MSGPASPGTTVQDPHPVLYFVSDVHLGGSPPREEALKTERLQALMRRVAEEGGALYILGDLFDFWFEYRTVIPRTGFGILSALDALARGGVPVRMLGGNHDIWLTRFLEAETALEVLPDGVRIEAQERTLQLFHGDGLGPGDTGYKILKRVLRNRMAIGLFRWIHPDLGIRLAMRSSHASREHTMGHPVDTGALSREVAGPILAGEADAVLMGHHHVAHHEKLETGEFFILGDWFRLFTCVRLAGGTFELLRWPLE
jgi:UDP-2,3-diacylglucosamine hydrolase